MFTHLTVTNKTEKTCTVACLITKMSSYVKSTYEYTKLRKTFGRQPLFQAPPAQLLDSIYPTKEDQKQYILRNPVNRFVQAVNPVSENEINTPAIEIQEQGINHLEGGWPRDVHICNEEHTQRHRRRVMHEESYYETVKKLAPPMQHYINQNNAIEMYQTYFSDIKPQEPKEEYSIRVANVFRDEDHRPISCVKFTEESNPKLAVAYCYKTCMPDSVNVHNDCHLWDLHKQTEPILSISPEYPCWQLVCSPVSPELFICGLENGTVCVFDVRHGKKAVSSSSVYNSHRESVTSLRYQYSRTHSEFFTGSTDGQCLWWDIRDLSKPQDQLTMSVRIPSSEKPTPSNAEGVSFLDYDPGLPTKFLCGTESGLVINTNRMGKTHSETLVSYWKAHNGPVQSIQRSTVTLRMFLTCGDYTVRIWSEEVRTEPIIVFNPYKNLLTDACWAPLRYSSFMSICAGGFFYYWDLLRKYKEPVRSLSLSKYELTKMSPDKDGKTVAVGDSHGDVYLLQLSENMAIPGSRDKILMQQTYERETKREHILDNRLKEIRLKARYEEEQALIQIETDSTVDDEEEDRATEEEYFRIVQEEFKNMDMFPDQQSNG
ncbi:dynein intermediate chain 3, ciliary-like [Anticarsia gemmatalis]|uniref:dynein intermediate chain 3, ciliary-like n=1 Tax=Anticarsia gemmatalis TaxID=129554 RepID=UPI003F75B5E6